MDAFKIIFSLLFCSYYCDGHFITRNYNNRQSPVFSSLNFQTFPEYFKPLYRFQYLTPSSTSKKIIQTHTPKPTEITNTKKLIVPSKQHGNGMLSITKNVKPFLEMMKNPRERVKKPTTGLDTMYEHQRNHALHLKLIPKMIKKEVANQLGKIFGKMTQDKVKNYTKLDINKTEGNKVEAIEITNNKDNTSAEQDKLKEMSLDEIKTKTAYVNKIEAKSIFGNFVGNKHFANIFIFYPNNDNSAVVIGLKDNMTDVFTENPEISTKNPIDHLFDKTKENGIEESLVSKHDDDNLVGNKDDESSNDKSDNTAVTTEVTVTTDNIILNSDATASTTITTVNLDKDNKNTYNDEDDLSSNKDNVEEEAKDDESKSTKDFSITSTPISTTTELFHTNSDDATIVNELTESPSENLTKEPNDKKDDELIVPPSTVANEVSESSYENLKDVQHGIKDDEIVGVQDSNKFEDPIKENDVDSTVVSTTVVNQVTETTSENLTEKLNEMKDEIGKEDNIHDQVKDESTVVPDESTVATDSTSVASTIKDNNATNTEVPSTTESHIEATSDSESESKGSSENTVESTTIDLSETLSTGGGESTTENTIDNDNSFEETTDDDYIEIEYTYF